MLATIGVASVDELFRDIPAACGFGRELDVAPALTEAELQRHLEELAGKNVVDEVCFLGAGIYDHYVPAVVDAVLQRGELLTAYTPYQPEMSQGVLQAIFEYQTAICELTGMDVSNASGYDGTTVAADACFVAKHATGTLEDRRHRGDEPAGAPGREDVRARLRARGRRGAARRRRDRPGPRARSRQRRGGRDLPAAELLRRASSPRPSWPRPRTTRARCRSRTSTSSRSACSRRRARTAVRIAIGEGQSAGNAMSYGGPHYGFLAARAELIRRLPGPDRRRDGRRSRAKRGYVLTLQTREQHIRREKATSNITTNQTLLALAGLVHLSLLGPQGLRELGETCMALAAYAKDAAGRRRARAARFRRSTTFKEFAVRTGRNAREALAAARAKGVYAGYPLGRDYAGPRRRAARRGHREANGRRDRPARRGARS